MLLGYGEGARKEREEISKAVATKSTLAGREGAIKVGAAVAEGLPPAACWLLAAGRNDGGGTRLP